MRIIILLVILSLLSGRYLLFDPLFPWICAVSFGNISMFHIIAEKEHIGVNNVQFMTLFIPALTIPLIEEFIFRLCIPLYLESQLPSEYVHVVSALIFSCFHIYTAEPGRSVRGSILQVTATFILGCILPLHHFSRSLTMHLFYNIVALLNLKVFIVNSSEKDEKEIYVIKRRRSWPLIQMGKLEFKLEKRSLPKFLEDGSRKIDELQNRIYSSLPELS